MVTMTDSAQKSIDRMERREKRIKRRKNRMPVHGKGNLTVIERQQEKAQEQRIKDQRQQKEEAQGK